MNKTFNTILDIYLDNLIKNDYQNYDTINARLGKTIYDLIKEEQGQKTADDFITTIDFIVSEKFKGFSDKFKQNYIEKQREYFKTLF